MLIRNAFLHACKILEHKCYVAYYCFRAGLYWQAVTHDLSKFSATEFLESIRFYRGTISPVAGARKAKGYSDAWLHHTGRNPHHYEYWIYISMKEITPLKMPFRYVLETVCDYLGAARAYERGNFTFEREYAWWLTRRDRAMMHPESKAFVEYCLKTMAETGNAKILADHKRLKSLYENGYFA